MEQPVLKLDTQRLLTQENDDDGDDFGGTSVFSIYIPAALYYLLS
jgi:hypothetical protein